MENLTRTFNHVHRNLRFIKKYQGLSLGHEARDDKRLLDTNSYVTKRSIGLSILIVLTSFLQIYFVKKFFETTSKIRQIH